MRLKVSDTVGFVKSSSRESRDGRAVRWDQHRQSRREELLDAVVQAVRAHGAAVGMDQIADTAGTSKAVFYRYFADKQDLYQSVGRKLAGDLVTDIAEAVGAETDDLTMLAAGVNAYLNLLESEPELYRFVVHNPTLGAVGADAVAGYTSLVSDVVSALFENTLSGRGFATDGAAPWGVAVVGGIRAAGDWWLAQPPDARPDREQLVKYLVALMYHGMAGITARRPVDDVRSLVRPT